MTSEYPNNEGLGYIDNAGEVYYFFHANFPLAEGYKSLAGIFASPPEIANPQKILSDEIFSKLLAFYIEHLRKFAPPLALRKKIIAVINSFTEGKLTKQELEERLDAIFKEAEKNIPLSIRKEKSERKLIPIGIKRNLLSVFFVKEGTSYIKKEISIEVEGRDYVFSEGIKIKAYKKSFQALGLSDYIEIVNGLEESFTQLSCVRQILDKISIVKPEFVKIEANKAYYVLKYANFFLNRKIKKIRETLLNDKIWNRWLKESYNPKELLSLRGKFFENLENYRYEEALFFYLVLKLKLKCLPYILQDRKEELKKLLRKAVKIYLDTLRKFKYRDFILQPLKGEGVKERRVSWGKEIGRIDGEKTVLIGRNLNLGADLSKWQIKEVSRYISWLKEKGFQDLTAIAPYDKFFPFEGKTVGEILDAILMAIGISLHFDGVWLWFGNTQTRENYKLVKTLLNYLLPNQTITPRALGKKYTVENAVLSFQKVRKRLSGDKPISRPVLIVYEHAVSNRIKEVVHSEFEEENLKTSHRIFKLYKLRENSIKEIGLIILLAGSPATAPMLKVMYSSDEELPKKVLFITKSKIGDKDAEKLVERFLPDAKVKVINRIKSSYFVVNPQSLLDKIVVDYNGKEQVLEFIHPLPPVYKNTGKLNVNCYSYENISQEDIRAIAMLHGLESDSNKIPFSEIKETKLSQLGKIILNNGKNSPQPVYKSILLVEGLFRSLFAIGKGELLKPLRISEKERKDNDEEFLF